MKKLLRFSVAVLSIAALTACASSSSTGKDGGKAASNKSAQVEIVDGEYIIPRDGSSGDKYLALKLKVKNVSGNAITFSQNDINLFDSDGEKIESEPYYSDDKDFKGLDFQKLSKDKSVSGYVVFDVEPDDDEKYELEFTVTDEKTFKATDPVTINLKPTDYKDHSSEALDAAEAFVADVFFNGGELVGQTRLSNSGKANVTLLTDKSSSSSSDKDKDSKDSSSDSSSSKTKSEKTDNSKYKEAFIKQFVTDLTGAFSSYQPTEAEAQSLISSYIQANAQRAKIQYSIKSYTPNLAEIYIRPETIDLTSLNTDLLIQEFITKNKDATFSDYSAAKQAAERYVFEQIPNHLSELSLKLPTYADKEGYLIRFVKENDQWVLDSSEKNYYYEELGESFSGYVDNWYFYASLY